METVTKRLYEGMYILSATLGENARKLALDKITQGITDKSGKVLKIHDMGKKRLAYEINKRREGYYYLLYFEMDTDKMHLLSRDYQLHEDLMRYMTLETKEVKETLTFKSLPQSK